MKFGKFESVEAFLESYAAAQRYADRRTFEGLDLATRRERLRRRKERDVVEVQSTVAEYLGTEGAGAKHQHILITIQAVDQSDPDVQADIDRVVSGAERVFVSVRYGDRMGLESPVPGVVEGLALHMRGEWIPRDKAYAHGGEKMSVLHFTHEPLGFICTPDECFS